MENASEALRIAGGVLIAVLVLGLLVVFYNNMQDWNKNQEMLTAQEQSADFNKQYSSYIRNLYGSELLSLVNKVDNYNKIESDLEGYSRMDVKVTFKNDIGGFKKDKSYTTKDIRDTMDVLEKNIKDIGKKTFKGKTISQLAVMRTNEFDQFIIDNGLTGSQKEQIKNLINQYTINKSDEVTIKSKAFKYVDSKYDNTTGRMELIEYKEI